MLEGLITMNENAVKNHPGKVMRRLAEWVDIISPSTSFR
jgi:hypothetical protein